MICDDDISEGEFQSDDPTQNKQVNAVNRLSLAVELLQTFINEIIFKYLLKRKTFCLNTDLKNSSNKNVCEIYRTKLRLKNALKMSENDLFVYIANEIKSNQSIYDPNCKYIAILSFTRYQLSGANKDMYENTKGYCALGINYFSNLCKKKIDDEIGYV